MKNFENKRIGFARDKARQVLERYFLNNPPARLPIPIREIAEFNGFEIYELESLNKHQRAIKKDLPLENRKLIGINSSYHKHNKRFSIGHELGHHFLEHPPEEDCDDEQIKTYNSEADEFSAELLMPLDILKEKIAEVKDLTRLARIFEVSDQALYIKITNQKLFSLL